MPSSGHLAISVSQLSKQKLIQTISLHKKSWQSVDSRLLGQLEKKDPDLLFLKKIVNKEICNHIRDENVVKKVAAYVFFGIFTN